MAIGQRTKLTPELQDAICALIRDKGSYPEVAAAACGISHTTFYEWMARGRVRSSSTTPGSAEPVEPGTRGLGDPQGLYADFADAINKANADLEVVLVTDALKKSRESKNPLSPVILLSRRFRERWSEQIQVASAGREAVDSMERIKEAWDTPEVVDGEYAELPGDQEPPKLEACNPEATESHNSYSTNPSEANSDLGFHLPPPSALLDTEPGAEDADQEPDIDQAPHDIDSQASQASKRDGRGHNQQ